MGTKGPAAARSPRRETSGGPLRRLLCRVFGHVWRIGEAWRECERCGVNQGRQRGTDDHHWTWVTISYLGPGGKLW
jgi:hypothetical protein